MKDFVVSADRKAYQVMLVQRVNEVKLVLLAWSVRQDYQDLL